MTETVGNVTSPESSERVDIVEFDAVDCRYGLILISPVCVDIAVFDVEPTGKLRANILLLNWTLFT